MFQMVVDGGKWCFKLTPFVENVGLLACAYHSGGAEFPLIRTVQENVRNLMKGIKEQSQGESATDAAILERCNVSLPVFTAVVPNLLKMQSQTRMNHCAQY